MNKQIQLLIELLLQNKIDVSLKILRDKDFMNSLIDIINLYLAKYEDMTFSDVKIDISLIEVKETTRLLLEKIIRKELFAEIEDLINNHLCITNDKEFDASVKLSKGANNIYKINDIILSDYRSIIAPASIAHECGHTLVLNNIDLNRFKNEYFEMFSILLDKIISYELQYSDKRYERIQEVNNNFRRIDFCYKAKSFLNSSRKDIPENNKYIIQLLSSQIIIGEIYATLLFSKYLEDNTLFIYLLDLVFNNIMSVDEFLNYYNININNNTYDELKLLLN